MQFASEFYDFIQTHRDADTDALLLKYAAKPLPFPLQDTVTQIIGRRKAAAKIPELIARGILFPSALLAEQCSSQSMADLHTTLIAPGANVADLTFGLGIDAFAMARKAAAVYGVETDAKAAEYGRTNAATLQARNITITHATAQEWAATPHPEIDTIFIDPARRKASTNRAYRFEDCSPNLCELLVMPGFQDKKLIVKASPMLDINYTMRALSGVKQIIIAAVKGECKEMIVVCHTAEATPPDATITAIDITPDATSRITVNVADHNKPAARIVTSTEQIHPGTYLYEPNAAVMKTAPWHHIETLYPGLTKISADAHIFISDEPIDDFPGRCRQVTHVYHSARQAVRELKNEAANIATKAYPLTPQELRRKLRLHPCPDQSRFLIGTTAAGKHLLIMADTI